MLFYAADNRVDIRAVFFVRVIIDEVNEGLSRRIPAKELFKNQLHGSFTRYWTCHSSFAPIRFY